MDSRTHAGSEERQTGENLGLETSALTFGRLLHRAMEMEWFDPQLYRDEIILYLEDEGVIETELQKPFLKDLSECLELYRKSDLASRLKNLHPSDKLADLPIF